MKGLLYCAFLSLQTRPFLLFRIMKWHGKTKMKAVPYIQMAVCYRAVLSRPSLKSHWPRTASKPQDLHTYSVRSLSQLKAGLELRLQITRLQHRYRDNNTSNILVILQSIYKYCIQLQSDITSVV